MAFNIKTIGIEDILLRLYGVLYRRFRLQHRLMYLHNMRRMWCGVCEKHYSDLPTYTQALIMSQHDTLTLIITEYLYIKL